MVRMNRAVDLSANSLSDDELFRKAYQYYKSGKLRSAKHLFLLSAQRGDSGAQTMLGYFYDTGVGARRNRKAALLWYKRAYRQGSRMAASNIGTVYRDDGNVNRALFWFRRAVKLRDGDASLEIAKILLIQRKDKSVVVLHLKRALYADKLDVTQESRDEARKILRKITKGPSRKVGRF